MTSHQDSYCSVLTELHALQADSMRSVWIFHVSIDRPINQSLHTELVTHSCNGATTLQSTMAAARGLKYPAPIETQVRPVYHAYE